MEKKGDFFSLVHAINTHTVRWVIKFNQIAVSVVDCFFTLLTVFRFPTVKMYNIKQIYIKLMKEYANTTAYV